jgi:hypothetical protein
VLPQVIEHLTRWRDYAARPKHSGWHLDHQLGSAHENALWPAYASSWWLAGQEADTSDICGGALRRRWWHPRRYAFSLPMIHRPGPPRKNDRIRVFFGTLDRAITLAHSSDARLLTWLHGVAERALDHGCLPAWRSPRLRPERVAALWPAGIARDSRSDAHDYPFNGLFKHALRDALQAV